MVCSRVPICSNRTELEIGNCLRLVNHCSICGGQTATFDVRAGQRQTPQVSLVLWLPVVPPKKKKRRKHVKRFSYGRLLGLESYDRQKGACLCTRKWLLSMGDMGGRYFEGPCFQGPPIDTTMQSSGVLLQTNVSSLKPSWGLTKRGRASLGLLYVDSPYSSPIVLFRNRPFSQGLKRRIPGMPNNHRSSLEGFARRLSFWGSFLSSSILE